ncbi:MAG: hypothetical protein HY906_08205 [Deltaproteobacteria bacterium]|nr:hypothetical protein [Deltaproteobacteria bacterium]
MTSRAWIAATASSSTRRMAAAGLPSGLEDDSLLDQEGERAARAISP